MASRMAMIVLMACCSTLLSCRCGSGQLDAPGVQKPDPCASASGVVDGDWRSVTVGQLQRQYILDVPAAQPGQKLPVVLSFHGIGGDPRSLRAFTATGLAAHELGFVAVHPEGEPVWLKGRQGPGWEVAAEDNRDVKFVGVLLDELEAAYCIDTSRVYAMGFSNGAHLAHVLGCKMSDRVAGIGAVGGALMEMEENCGSGSPVPAAIIHGISDPVVGIADGREAAEFWIEKNGCSDTRKATGVCTMHTGGDAEVLVCEVPGLSHSWPRKETGNGIDATVTLLGFFGLTRD